ncbi:MAG: hypothetical protein ACXWZZ_14080, partial [Solirubrobacteraceae bacterium]
VPSGVCADRRATARAAADGAARAIDARRMGAHCAAWGSARSGSGVPTGRAPRAGAGMSGTASLDPPEPPCPPQPPSAATPSAAAAAAVSR